DWASVRLILRNRPYMLIVGAKIFQFLAFASVATTSLLFKLNVLLVGYMGLMQLALAQNIASALSMPFWLWMERQWGKRDAYISARLPMIVGQLSWFVADSSSTLWGLIGPGIPSGVASGGMILPSISMFADSLAHDRGI